MIGIVSLNPCIDRTLYLSRPLRPGDSHRADRALEQMGGKGLNQARVLGALGVPCDYFSFGDAADRRLAGVPFGLHLVPTACGMRQNVKVIDGEGVGTELSEAGGPILPAEWEALLDGIDRFEGDVLSLCGSIPVGVPGDIYGTLIERARRRHMITVLDADGEALRAGLAACPTLIKPNRRELGALFGMEQHQTQDESTVIGLCRRVWEQYGTAVLCTLDADGSLYVGPEGVARVGAAKVSSAGFAGAGDAYLAAYLAGRYAACLGVEKALSLAARAAGAKVALEGTTLPTRAQIERVEPVGVEWI